MRHRGQRLLRANDVAALEQLLHRTSGLRLVPGLRHTLEDAVRQAATSLATEPRLFLARLLAGDRQHQAALMEFARVGETYFFRAPEQLGALAGEGFALLGRPAPLRIWSAGCSTGEEPYSVAMALSDAGVPLAQVRILATDLSNTALAQARAATYGDWAFRRLEPAARERHFEGAARVRVRAELREVVELRRHNLALDLAPPEQFHAVLCENVLIYFERNLAVQVLRKLVDALAPGGMLLLSTAEIPLAQDLMLERLELGGATLLRKTDGVRRRPATPTPARASALVAHAVRAAAPEPAAAPRPPQPTAEPTLFERARDAAHHGELEKAEALAREQLAREPQPESYLLLATVEESREKLGAAIEAVRRALYLDPELATAHAMLAALLLRLGKPEEAEQARRNALAALEGLDAAAELRGVEHITAGALRRALELRP